MSFIGNVPAEAYAPVAKDTFSGNGSTTDFTLSIPATTNGVEVFVENVQQEPTDAYTISGTTLSFTAAPVSGTDNIYVIHRGPAVQQVVPPAGVALNPSTVTATGDISTEGDLKVEVASGGIYTITGTDTSSNRTLTLPDEAGTVLTSASDITPNAGSAFSAVRITSSQNISSSTWTKIECQGETFDVNGEYDNTTNYRFTPTVEGYYSFNVIVNVSGSSVTRVIAGLYKNGLEYWVGSDLLNLNGASRLSTSTIAYMNGSTDYMEGYGYITATSPKFDFAGSVTQINGSAFQGFLVRAV